MNILVSMFHLKEKLTLVVGLEAKVSYLAFTTYQDSSITLHDLI